MRSIKAKILKMSKKQHGTSNKNLYKEERNQFKMIIIVSSIINDK